MSENDLPPDLLRPREAARLLGIHLATLYRWLDAGKLPCYRLGGFQRRISRRDAVAMLQVEQPRKATVPARQTMHERDKRSRETLAVLRRHGLGRYV